MHGCCLQKGVQTFCALCLSRRVVVVVSFRVMDESKNKVQLRQTTGPYEKEIGFIGKWISNTLGKVIFARLILINPLSANPTKWSNTLKQLICLSVFDHFVGVGA